jgi:hypothetical protein
MAALVSIVTEFWTEDVVADFTVMMANNEVMLEQ